jgi:hypothetical protein
LALRAQGSAELDELLSDLTPPGPITQGLARAVVSWSALTAHLAAAWRTPRLPRLVFPRYDRTVLTIGRAADCDLALRDLTVSWHHAELRRVAEGWVLADLGSTNGTHANGWRVVSPFTVRSGDWVTFGRSCFRLADHA